MCICNDQKLKVGYKDSEPDLVALCRCGLVVGVEWTSCGRDLTGRRGGLPVGACSLVHVRINHIGI